MTSVADHLRDRYMLVSNYHTFIDEEDRTATFLLFNLSGMICGFQRYRPDADKAKNNDPKLSRYYTYKTPGQIAVFGLETFTWSRPLFLTEGIFDCVRLHNLGYSAIAALSNDPKFLAPWLRAISRPIYAICDSGNAGKKLAEYAHFSTVCPEGLDLGSMRTSDVIALTKECLK